MVDLVGVPGTRPATQDASAPEPGRATKRPVDVMAMVRDERAEMADFLASLRAEQWDQPSLCRGWRVRDVAAHAVSYEEHGSADLMRRLARARFRPGASILQERLG